MKYKDYYQAIGLERTATSEEIKKAYRKLAHQYHPDVSTDPAGEEKFKALAEAYATLKDPEKRKAYDDLGQRPAGEQFTPPPDWQQHFRTDASGFDDVDLADIFSAFSHGRQQREKRPVHGQDYEVLAGVTLEQIFLGSAIDVRAELPEYDKNGLAHRKAHSFQVTLPKSAFDGQRLRLAGKGGTGLNGGRAGDLYVALSVKPHALYRVNGRDLFLDLPLAPWEAVLGASIRIPTLAGPVELKIKAGTIAGHKLRLGKRGLMAADGSFGAQYAVVRIEVPATTSPREQVLYEQLAANSEFRPRQYFDLGETS